MIVNIEVTRYDGGVKKTDDPDVLLLHALSDPTRLAIVRQLSERGNVCACDFVSCCEVGQPTVSHHLKVLKDAGWVCSERRGSWVWYTLSAEAVARLHAIVGAISPGPSRPLAAASRSTAQHLTFTRDELGKGAGGNR
jgi:DNA-binding transcriptional ArsR family regulator